MLRDCSDSEDSFSGDDDPPPAASVRDREPSELIPTSQATVNITGEEPSSQATPTGEIKEDTAPKDENAENKAGDRDEDGEGEGEGEGEEEEAPEDKGDPEMAPIYLKKMLPVFTELFHSSLAPPLR